MKKMELLSPAGSLQTLRAVLAAGADAVYVGGDRFGARAYAKNFTTEELMCAIDETHLQGKKLHLTVNTLLRSEELKKELYAYLLPFYEQGLDALIVQDMGVFSFVKQEFPDLELHASTQMTIASADGAAYLRDAGADRIVLARELSLSEIKRIHETADVPIECFVHGAICYCYSGMCLFSSMLGGRSGNRGRCAQPCRLGYGVEEHGKMLQKEKLFPLSPKDLCAIDLLPKLYDAGVCSLKIEGRMKQTGYAAGVTEIYRKYLDLYEAGETAAVSKEDRRRLFELGNRDGFTDGYLRAQKGRSMISLYDSSHSANATEKSNEWTAKKRELVGVCTCRVGKPISFIVTDVITGKSVEAKGDILERAKQAPADPAAVKKVLLQTGDTPFAFDKLELVIDENCFIPKQFLKTIRRDALSRLQQMLLQAWRRSKPAFTPVQKESNTDSLQTSTSGNTNRLFVVCDTLTQLKLCIEKDYIETVAFSVYTLPRDGFAEQITKIGILCKQKNKRLLLSMPPVLREDAAEFYEKQWNCIEFMQKDHTLAGFLAKSYDTLGFLQRMQVERDQIWLDASLYTFSERAVFFFTKQGYRYHTLPYELNAAQLQLLPKAGSCLCIYGHTPFMVSSQCIQCTMKGCDKKEHSLQLIDRYGKKLPVKNYCSICCNMIFNAVPTVLFEPEVFSQVQKVAPEILRMDFTIEDEKSTRAVLTSYEKWVLGKETKEHVFVGESTRGHWKRGVE